MWSESFADTAIMVWDAYGQSASIERICALSKLESPNMACSIDWSTLSHMQLAKVESILSAFGH